MKGKIIYKLLGAFAALPLSALYLFSDFITLVLYHLVRYRRKVVHENLTSSFPEKSLKEIRKIERDFYRYLGDQIVETIKLLHISDEKLKTRVKVENFEIVNDVLSQGKNAVLLMGHYCNWEWVQEITRYFIPSAFMISIYHPLSNKIFDDLFIKLRSRWGAHMVPMEKAPRTLLNREHQPWVCGFIADAWTWKRTPYNCVEFLNHKTWFISGSEEIGRKVGAEFFYLEMNRIKRGHYLIKFHPLSPSDPSVPNAYTLQFWKEFEKTIERAPAYWLWSHKRWK